MKLRKLFITINPKNFTFLSSLCSPPLWFSFSHLFSSAQQLKQGSKLPPPGPPLSFFLSFSESVSPPLSLYQVQPFSRYKYLGTLTRNKIGPWWLVLFISFGPSCFLFIYKACVFFFLGYRLDRICFVFFWGWVLLISFVL